MPIPALLLAFAAQAAAGQISNAVVSRHNGRPFISPMGEPFRAGPSGDALADWFSQADRNHDGVLTVDEMQADAARFFATLDTNHDGEIDPDEIEHYENVIAPEIDTSPGARLARAQVGNGNSSGRSGRGGSGGRGHHHGGGGNYGGGDGGGEGLSGDLDNPIGGGRFGLLNIPEPVASADADFNRGVSLEEFKQAASKRFALLDVNRTGRLTLPELETQREAEIAASRRRTASAPATEEDSQSDAPPL